VCEYSAFVCKAAIPTTVAPTTTTTVATTTTTTVATTTTTTVATTTTTMAPTTVDSCPVAEGGCTSPPLITSLGLDQVDGPHHVQWGDVDGDGFQDVVVASAKGGRVDWLQIGVGFATTKNLIMDIASDPRSIQLADVDNDNDLDVIIVFQGAASIALALNDGTGNFNEVSFIDQALAKPFNSAVGDFNNDGFVDLAVTDRNANSVLMYLNKGNATIGNAAQPQFSPIASIVVNGAFAVEVADVDGDGNVDVIVGSRDDDRVVVHFNTGLDGSGEPTFSATIISSSVNVCEDPRSGTSVTGMRRSNLALVCTKV